MYLFKFIEMYSCIVTLLQNLTSEGKALSAATAFTFNPPNDNTARTMDTWTKTSKSCLSKLSVSRTFTERHPEMIPPICLTWQRFIDDANVQKTEKSCPVQAIVNRRWIHHTDGNNVTDGCKQARSFLTALSEMKGERSLLLVLFNLCLFLSVTRQVTLALPVLMELHCIMSALESYTCHIFYTNFSYSMLNCLNYAQSDLLSYSSNYYY